MSVWLVIAIALAVWCLLALVVAVWIGAVVSAVERLEATLPHPPEPR